jgi:ribosomal protein L11 methyltransferase
LGKASPALDIHVPACDPQLLDLLIGELDEFHPTAIQELDTPHIQVFFTSPRERDAAARAIASTFGIHLIVRPLDVDHEDWAARSQARLQSITVGGITVSPPWDVRPGALIIRPSTGFGTGHHATTRLMLRALQQAAVDGRHVLDVGCGSGVLTLAAARLGAAAADGIDIDPEAIDNALENQGLNDLIGRVRFTVADLRGFTSPADVVMANLTGRLLQQSATRLWQLVEPDGILIASGFMESENPDVLAALERSFSLEKIDQEEEWLCAVWTRQP